MIDKKIEEILLNWHTLDINNEGLIADLKSLFKEYAMEIIGESEGLESGTENKSISSQTLEAIVKNARNQLRNELRERINL